MKMYVYNNTSGDVAEIDCDIVLMHELNQCQ